MSGKGSKPRPIAVDQETYASNWDAIFKPTAPSSNSRAPTSNVEDLRANRSGAAIYIDNESGAEVTDSWWPGDPIT